MKSEEFHSGNSFDSYNRLGAHTDIGGTMFRVFAPNADSAATYDPIAPQLVSYCKEYGYNCVELMPLNEYPSDDSWGYQATGFFAPTARYGEAVDLKKLVDICHRNGIAVLLDFVPVHFAVDGYALANFDGTPLYESEHSDIGCRV